MLYRKCTNAVQVLFNRYKPFLSYVSILFTFFTNSRIFYQTLFKTFIMESLQLGINYLRGFN